MPGAFRQFFKLLALSLSLPLLLAGQTPNQTSTEADDVLRINTELVQTDVMVFDRHGHFIDGLKPEQFDLLLDGRPRKIQFFGRVTSGTAPESSKLSANASNETGTDGPAARVSVVDVDRHFARGSVMRFQTYVYNAATHRGSPDVWIDALVFRRAQPVMTVAPNKISPDVSKDPSWLPYWSEIVLEQLPAGWSATDKVTGSKTSRRTSFVIQ